MLPSAAAVELITGQEEGLVMAASHQRQVQPEMLNSKLMVRNREHGLPARFSWLEPGWLAGTSAPGSINQLRALVVEGVAHLVSLSPEYPPPKRKAVEGLTIHYIDIEDFEAPSMEQLFKFIKVCEEMEGAGEGKGVAVHCLGGNGRTGTLLAAWLVWAKGWGAGAAVREVRGVRPGAVESWPQVKAVFAFQRALEKGYEVTGNYLETLAPPTPTPRFPCRSCMAWRTPWAAVANDTLSISRSGSPLISSALTRHLTCHCLSKSDAELNPECFYDEAAEVH
jgi:atypical dual specificity phosphatase